MANDEISKQFEVTRASGRFSVSPISDLVRISVLCIRFTGLFLALAFTQRNSPKVPPPIWTEGCKIHSYEVDSTGAVSLEMICRYFQEAAWNHAEALGVGFERLASEQKLWVLSRLLIQIERLPVWGETIEVQTWPRAVEGPFAMRDFQIFDSAGRKLVAGTSAWLVLAVSSRRPQRVDKLLTHLPDTAGRRSTPRSPEKLPDETHAGHTDTARCEIDVRHSDLDVNNHVNNSRYLGWLLDTYPAEFHRKSQVHSCEVNYLGETGAGDRLLIESRSAENGIFTHRIGNKTGEVVCRARVAWSMIK
jgi:acyl-ACP thioesterase